MPHDMMRYDLLMQDAVRGVMRAALKRVAAEGLPGAHHYYITFDTTHPGVEISNALRATYPQEMTIVIQHQYWDLQAREETFEISLNFNKVPEHLVVPYAAVRNFLDPSVEFALQFAPVGLAGSDAEAPPAALPSKAGADKSKDKPKMVTDKTKSAGESGEIVSLDSFRKK